MQTGEADEAAPQPVVVWCLAADYGAGRFYYSTLHPLPSASAGRLRRLSVRFLTSVNSQQSTTLNLSDNVCAASKTTLRAASLLTSRMAPLLNLGYIPVAIGVY